MMTYDKSIAWIDEIKARGIAEVAADLGTVRGAGRQLTFACPACREEVRSKTNRDKRGPVLVVHGGKGWYCVKCKAKGGVPDFIAYTVAGDRYGQATRDAVRSWAADRGLCEADTGETAARVVRPTVTWRKVERARPQPADEGERAAVQGLWDRCVPVGDDDEVAAYLTSRALSPSTVEDRDLARALPHGVPLPRWARAAGQSWRESGHRLILPLYGPNGALASLRARAIAKADRKSLAPAGLPVGGLVLGDGLARQILKTGRVPEWWPIGEPLRVIVAEGDPDFLTWATQYPEREATAPAVISITGSGSWSIAIADRIPSRSVVYVQTHTDESGEKYAHAIASGLAARCRVLVRRSEVTSGR